MFLAWVAGSLGLFGIWSPEAHCEIRFGALFIKTLFANGSARLLITFQGRYR